MKKIASNGTTMEKQQFLGEEDENVFLVYSFTSRILSPLEVTNPTCSDFSRSPGLFHYCCLFNY